MSEMIYPFVKFGLEVCEDDSNNLQIELSNNGGVSIKKEVNDDFVYMRLSPIETAFLKKFLENIDFKE